MKTFSKMALAAAFSATVLSASTAMANEIRLDKPATGATLHGREIDMSVYYTEDNTGAFVVVATYLGKSGHDEPGRLVMALSDGEKVQFGIPGERGSIYMFVREGNRISVIDLPAARPLNS